MLSGVRVLRLSACALIGLGVAAAQVFPPGGGGYPGGGGGYPGGRSPYPGGGGSGLPIPGKRGSQSKTPKTDGQPMPNFRGTLKHIDDKSISIELGDNRVMDFKRTGKTKFFKGGEEIKAPKFNPGDQLSIEGPEEPGGFMTAVNVYWEKAAAAPSETGTARSPEKDKAEGVPDTWAKDAEAGKAQSAERTPPAARPDDDDPGRPVLRRGGPASDRERPRVTPAQSEPLPIDRPPVQIAENRRPATPSDDERIPVVRRGAGDDLIRKATDAALDFTESLPAYVCQEMMTRYQGQGNPVRWSAIDVVTMNLVYENSKEDYRDIQVNGKPRKSLEETGGAWSTGEFGTVLIGLFSPATAADFKFQRDSRVNGISAKVYDFSVQKEHSAWSIHMGSQSYDPAYKGSVWIDPSNGRVMRIEMQAYGFPGSFPADHVESATDYQYIRLGDAKQYLLPVHAETLTCQRGSDICSRNTIDFRNYHKYSGESSITFDTPKK
jgi:hypothetical protein